MKIVDLSERRKANDEPPADSEPPANSEPRSELMLMIREAFGGWVADDQQRREFLERKSEVERRNRQKL